MALSSKRTTKVLAFGLLFWAQVALGQGVVIAPQTALKTVNGVTSVIPGATITVCAANIGGLPCSPALVGATFKDPQLTQPLANPFTADANGNYNFAIATGTYTVTVTASGFTGYSYQLSAPCLPASCAGIGKQMSVQTFTSSGTFTIPVGVTSVKATVVGGGGAGGGASTVANTPGHGGASGGAAIKFLSGLTPGNTLTVTVGAGGTGVSNAPGGTGGLSSVASGTQVISTITANGGTGGNTVGTFGAGTGGTASGGDLNFSGTSGQFGLSAGGVTNAGGTSGPSIFGGGVPGGTVGVAGSIGGAPGAAGSGGGSGGGGNVAGGAGANGIVTFEWVN